MYRLQIDIESEEGVLCQNGTLKGPLDNTRASPFPLRIPSLPPPCRFRGLKCAIVAQFGAPEPLEGMRAVASHK